jgi:hypothetical protein
MSTFRLVFSIFTFCLGIYVVLKNWRCVLDNRKNRAKGLDQFHEVVPLVSIIYCGTAALIYPYWPRWWMLLPVLVDKGTWNLCSSMVRHVGYGKKAA